METMVCFQAASRSYCVPVGATRAVRPVEDLVALPDPADGVVGIVPGDPPLTVISPLGSQGEHILVLEAGGHTFGLLVDEVTGLERIEDGHIRPTPRGQTGSMVVGTLQAGGRLVLVADPSALAARL